MESINWDEEAKNLKTSGDFEKTPFFKPKEGKQQLLILGERGIRDVKMPDGKIQKKLFLDIECNKEKFTWSVTVGQTKRSLFGQLAILGAYWGDMQGRMITLIVKGDGKLRSYSIREAEDLESDIISENGEN